MGDVWVSTEQLPDGGYRTVHAPVSGTPAPLGPDTRMPADQVAAIVRDLSVWLEGNAASPTARRLARALRDAGAPAAIVADALTGRYDEDESDAEFPTMDLITDLTAEGMTRFVERVESGEFDPPVPVRHLAAA